MGLGVLCCNEGNSYRRNQIFYMKDANGCPWAKSKLLSSCSYGSWTSPQPNLCREYFVASKKKKKKKKKKK